MLRSLAVVLAFIAAIWLLSLFSRSPTPDPVPTIDYTAQLQAARQTAPYDVLAPTPLPRGWRATSVSATGDSTGFTWQMGFLTGQTEYVELEQSNVNPAAFVAAETEGSSADGTTLVEGERWQRRADPGADKRSLVRVDSGVATVVTGTLGYPGLVEFASSLR
jgi:hypothetical protein